MILVPWADINPSPRGTLPNLSAFSAHVFALGRPGKEDVCVRKRMWDG